MEQFQPSKHTAYKEAREKETAEEKELLRKFTIKDINRFENMDPNIKHLHEYRSEQ